MDRRDGLHLIGLIIYTSVQEESDAEDGRISSGDQV
jgi:hypothetical protein